MISKYDPKSLKRGLAEKGTGKQEWLTVSLNIWGVRSANQGARG